MQNKNQRKCPTPTRLVARGHSQGEGAVQISLSHGQYAPERHSSAVLCEWLQSSVARSLLFLRYHPHTRNAFYVESMQKSPTIDAQYLHLIQLAFFYSLLWLEVHCWVERCHVFDFMSFTWYKSNKGVLEPWEQGLCLIRVASCLSLAFWTPGQHLARVHRTSSVIDVRT